MKLAFYEPPMCCPTGVCGPSVDENLVQLSETIAYLTKTYPDLEVQRYMISRQPFKFRENEHVYRLVKEEGRQILPITTLDGEVFAWKNYPTREDIERRLKGE